MEMILDADPAVIFPRVPVGSEQFIYQNMFLFKKSFL